MWVVSEPQFKFKTSAHAFHPGFPCAYADVTFAACALLSQGLSRGTRSELQQELSALVPSWIHVYVRKCRTCISVSTSKGLRVSKSLEGFGHPSWGPGALEGSKLGPWSALGFQVGAMDTGGTHSNLGNLFWFCPVPQHSF